MLFTPAAALESSTGPPSGQPVSVQVNIQLTSWSPTGEFGLEVGNSTLIVKTGNTSFNLEVQSDISLNKIAWRPDGSYALIIGERGTILKFTNSRVGLQAIDSGTTVDLLSVSWRPDGTYALISGDRGVVLRFDHCSQTVYRFSTGLICDLSDIRWDPSGQNAKITDENGSGVDYPPAGSAPPEVAFLEPSPGATLSGEVLVRGTAGVVGGTITGVDVRLDGSDWCTASGTEQWQFKLDTRRLSNDRHVLAARAWSGDGLTAERSVEFAVMNVREPPGVAIARPADSARVEGMLEVSGSAGPAGLVERVDFRMDDTGWSAAAGIEAWKVTVDTTTLVNGVHRFQARAWDGERFSAAWLFVIVENLPSEPAGPREPRPAREPGPPVEPAPVPEPPAVRRNGPPPVIVGPDPRPPAVRFEEGSDRGLSVEAVGAAVMLMTGLAIASEQGKFAILKFLFVPLYSRIRKDRVLDNFTRGMIYGFIMSNPGVHYNFIKQKLGLNNGSIVYHLTVLERQELIKSEKVGLFKRFYPAGRTLSETGVMELNEAQERLLELVRERPGLTQRDLSDLTGMSTRVVNYHIGLLQRARLVSLERDGKSTRCFATERMPVC